MVGVISDICCIKKDHVQGWVCSPVVEHLPTMGKVLSSIPSTARRRKKRLSPKLGLW
jgi:hypothetical protein